MEGRGSQIPAFGDWEYVNDLPITQYFECARQAGLIRYSSSSGECDCGGDAHLPANGSNYSADLYGAAHLHHPRSAAPPPSSRPRQGKGREKRGGGGGGGAHTHGKEGSRKQAGKVFDVTVTELPAAVSATAAGKRHPVPGVKKKQQQFQYDAGLRSHHHQQQQQQQPRRSAPKAVDEDLYKIPPDMLKRKRRLGFISRCLVPPCAV